MSMKNYSARTVDEAITKACIDLGVSSDHLKIEIVSEGSAGFLGFGSKPAEVRVRPLTEEELSAANSSSDDASAASVDDRSEESLGQSDVDAFQQNAAEKTEKFEDGADNTADFNRNDEEADRNDETDTAASEASSTDTGAFSEPDVSGSAFGQNTYETDEIEAADESSASVKSGYGKEAEADFRRGGRKNRHSGDRRNSSRPEEKRHSDEPVERSDEEVALLKDAASEFLSKVFGAMEMPVTIESEYDPQNNVLAVNFDGDDMGILIGKRGQTLDSLQYLTSLVVNKTAGQFVRVKLDTEDYRRRRKETLENLANNIARKVKRTGEAVSLEPMNPYERRIIHSCLQGNRYVETYSEGTDPYRHVVIAPVR
jgi:spoIIIJ-associated protein